MPTVGVATRAILQDIPDAILFYLERHAAVDALVPGRNVILIHNKKRAHFKQFLNLLVAGLQLKVLVRSALDIIVAARNGAHSAAPRW